MVSLGKENGGIELLSLILTQFTILVLLAIRECQNNELNEDKLIVSIRKVDISY